MQTNIHADTQANICMLVFGHAVGRLIKIQTDMQTKRYHDMQTNMQIDRQTDKLTYAKMGRQTR